jgi:hypothetical protein
MQTTDYGRTTGEATQRPAWSEGAPRVPGIPAREDDDRPPAVDVSAGAVVVRAGRGVVTDTSRHGRPGDDDRPMLAATIPSDRSPARRIRHKTNLDLRGSAVRA